MSQMAVNGVEIGSGVRELPEAEWWRMRAYEPFTSGGLPEPGHWRIIVAEDGGEIVAFSCIFLAFHCEPTWIAPDHRHHPKLLLDLWRGVRQTIADLGEGQVFATASPAVAEMWAKLGFRPSPDRLLVGRLSELPD